MGEDETAIVSIMIEDVEDAKGASIILNYDKECRARDEYWRYPDGDTQED